MSYFPELYAGRSSNRVLRKAKLIRKSTEDGLVEFKDHVEIGRRYRIELPGRFLEMFNVHSKVFHTKLMVKDFDTGEMIPLECLELVV